MLKKSMPYLLLLQFLLLPCLKLEAMAAYASATALTQSIVIYPDRALVKKNLPVTASKGENRIEVIGLTPSMIDDSVQAGISGAEKVRIIDIEVRHTTLVKTNQDQIKELQSQIDKIDEKLVQQKNSLTLHQNSLAFLQRVLPFPQNQNTSFPTVRDYLVAMEQTMSDRLNKIAEGEKTIADLNQQKSNLEKEKRNLGSAHDGSKNVLITVYAEAPTTFNLEYSYILRDVQWTPKYEIRADSLAQKLELNFFAIIKQSSGEDFSGVNVEISTARPAIAGELPELRPWRLDIYTPPNYQPYGRAKRSEHQAEMELLAAPQGMMAAAPAADAVAEPEVRSEATSMSYVLTQKIALLSDNQPHKILVSSSGCEAKFEYLAIPKLAKFAALTAEIQNPFHFPLLQGEMNVFLDGRFVSTSTVERPVMAGKEIRLSLGMDESIYVTHKLQKQFTEQSGAFTKKVHKHYEYQTEIVNGKSRPITLLVRDQVPVSAHEEIKVEVLSPTAGEAKSDEDGTVTWTLSLGQTEKRQLTTIFDVSYPEGKKITGI